jgi:hypothetical protein
LLDILFVGEVEIRTVWDSLARGLIKTVQTGGSRPDILTCLGGV